MRTKLIIHMLALSILLSACGASASGGATTAREKGDLAFFSSTVANE
ncbi:MAG: hypothetical protein ACKOBL_07210 [Chloroflexota bacterium]